MRAVEGMTSESHTLRVLVSLRVFSIRLLYYTLLGGEYARELLQSSHLVLHPLVLLRGEVRLKDLSAVREREESGGEESGERKIRGDERLKERR